MRELLIAFAIVTATMSIVNAETIHVNETGWWFEGGSFNESATPIQSAVNNASDGDTILIEPGYYSIANTIDVNKAVNLIGNGTTEQIIVNTSVVETVFHFHDKLFPMVEMKNLTIVGRNNYWDKVILVENYGFLEIGNVNVTDTDGWGIYAKNSTIRVKDSKIKASRCIETRENSYIEILNNQIDSSSLGIFLHESLGLISNNGISGYTGVKLDYATGTISNNVVEGHNGIDVSESDNVSISNNTIKYHGDCEYFGWGLYISSCSRITAENNTLTGSNVYTRGIWIYRSNNFTFENNEVKNSKYGLYIHYSSNGNFENNNLTNNVYSIRIEGNNVNHYVHTFTDDTVNGKPVYYYVNANGVTVSGNVGFVGIVNSRNVYADVSISENYQGVLIINSSDVFVEGDICNCYHGVYIRWSDNATFSGEVYKDDSDYKGGNSIHIVDSNASVIDATISQTSGSGYGVRVEDSSVTIRDTSIPGDFSRSIWLSDSYNCLIENVTVEKDVIYLSETTHSTILNCSISTDYDAIDLYWSDYNAIENCTINSKGHGIFIRGSHYNFIGSNKIENCQYEGVWLMGSDNNEIVNNEIENCGYGISVSQRDTYSGYEESRNNTLEGNVVRNCNFGIRIHYSENTTMRNNIMENNEYNFGVEGEKLNHFTHNIDTSNTVNGKPIYYYVNANGITIDSSTNAGYVGVVNSENVVIRDLTLSNNRQCVLIAYSKDCTVENVVTHNYSIAGIDVESSENVTINDCEAYDCGKFSLASGVKLHNSTHCSVSGHFHDNDEYYNDCGVYLKESDYNTISGEFVGNGRGVYLDHSDHNVVEGNISDNKYGVYVDSSNSNTIEDSTIVHNYYSGVYMYGSNNEIRNCNVSLSYCCYGDGININDGDNNVIENCTFVGNADSGIELNGDGNVVANNTIDDNSRGVVINGGTGNRIENNSVTDGNYGVYVKSQYNVIRYNNITNNNYGIYLTNSYNEIYLNNFVDNANQAYSSGVNTWKSFNATYEYNGSTYTGYLGNYWCDYTGSDADGDGIGDTPYTIDANDVDHYPLIEPRESYGNVTPVPPPTYNVTGWIHYGGWDYGGKIYVFAKNATTHEIVSYTDLNSWGDYPKFYKLELPNGSYYIEAYMDLNGNNLLDEDEKEPWGYAINKNPYAGQSADVITVNGVDVANNNVTLMRPSPEITSYSPESDVVENDAGESRWFSVSADERVNVTWFINGTVVKTDSKVTSSTYANSSAEAGVWIVRAVIENPFGSDEHEWTWIVHGISPIANFTYTPSDPVVGESVKFNASLSYDPDGYIVSYEWEFGDGTQVTTNNPIVDHTYTASGSYTVNLTVIDNDGLSDRTSKVITVKQSHPALISCDASGSPKDYFAPGESVYVKGNNLEPNTAYKIWIQPEPVSDGNPLNPEDDPSGEQEIVITDENGNFGTIVIWCVPADAEPTYEHWDIVADKQDDGANTGVYNSESDAIDSATTFGIVAPIPELSTLALVCLGLFGILVGRRIL